MRLWVTSSQFRYGERCFSWSLIGENGVFVDFGHDVDPHLSVDAIHDRVDVWKTLFVVSFGGGIHCRVLRGIYCRILLAERLVSVIRVESIGSTLRRQDLWELLDAGRFSGLCDQNALGDTTQFLMLPVRISYHSDKAVDRDHLLPLRHDRILRKHDGRIAILHVTLVHNHRSVWRRGSFLILTHRHDRYVAGGVWIQQA